MSDKKEWPVVTVVICTYDRPKEIRRTIDSLVTHLDYPNLRWHIADDGSPANYAFDVMHYLISDFGYDADLVTGTVTQRMGWGVNVNTALRDVKSEYIFFTEDDYVLLKPLDLRPHVALMELRHNIGMVRYGIAGHGLLAAVRETDVSEWLPNYQENGGKDGYSGQGKLCFLEISLTQSVGPFGFYKYSNRPHLKHRRFHEHYGYHPEGVGLAATEDGMNHLIKDGAPGPEIVCPAGWINWHFNHIGVSRQGSDADKETVKV